MIRPTLRALARSRGYLHLETVRLVDGWQRTAYGIPGEHGCRCSTVCIAPLRRAATEGLRAALLAMPAKKTRERR